MGKEIDDWREFRASLTTEQKKFLSQAMNYYFRAIAVAAAPAENRVHIINLDEGTFEIYTDVLETK